MKSTLSLIIAFVILFGLTACEDSPTHPKNVWKTSAAFSGPERIYAAGFSIGNKGYIGGGQKMTNYYQDFWEFDPETGAWTQKQDFPGGPRNYAIGFSIGSKGYMGTGWQLGTLQKDMWEFNPATNTWTQVDDYSGGEREYVLSFVVNGKAYAGGGIGSTGIFYTYPNDFWEFDPTREAGEQWVQKKDIGDEFYTDGLPGGAGKGFSFAMNDKGYLGVDLTNHFFDFWEYTPATDSWRSRTSFTQNVGQSVFTSFAVKKKGYLQTETMLLMYNPSSDSWTEKKPLPVALRYATSFTIGGFGYVGLGVIGTDLSTSLYRYTPQ